MDDISIFDLQQALEPALGVAGARRQIISALYRGDIHARCRSFVGVNAKDFNGGNYPDVAKDFDLPTVFWSLSGWIDDGERPGADAGERTVWSTNTSWARGDFALSGSRRRGAEPVVRRAIGVSICRSGVRSFLKQFGVAAPGSTEEMAEWSETWIREQSASGHKFGQIPFTAAFIERFPEVKRQSIRSFHTNAKRAIGN
jgi:hypothetical protein